MRRVVVVGVVVVVLAAGVLAGCAPPSSIAGTIVSSGRGVAGAEVTAFGTSGQPVASSTSAADGTYVLGPMTPGAYRVQAVVPGLGASGWYGGGTTFATAADVVVTADAVAGADIVVTAGGGGTTTTTTTTTTTSSTTTTSTTSSTTTTVPPTNPSRPVLLGSASNRLGNDASSCAQFQPQQVAPCGPQTMTWASIDGPYMAFAQGDPYTTKCPRNDANPVSTVNGDPATCDDAAASNGARNPLYKRAGYRFAVDVGAADLGKPLTVAAYDLGDYPRSVGSTGTPDCDTTQAPFNAAPYTTGPVVGAANCQTGDVGAVNTEVQLYDNDGNDGTVALASPVDGCRVVVPKETSTTSTAATYKNKWATVCTFTPTMVGVYPLTVRTSAIPGLADDGVGLNGFSLRVSGGSTTGMRAIDDLPVWANTPGFAPRFYLTELGSADAGKTLVLDLFDPGDSSATAPTTIQVLAPPSGAPSAVPTGGAAIPAANVVDSCTFNASASSAKGPATPNSSSTCTITTSTGGTAIYNSAWLRITVKLSAAYSCTSDCWWSIRYQYGSGSSATDRTVVSASIQG